MKRINSIIIAVSLALSLFAQAPEKMSYQAVIRNSSDQLVTNQNIGMQISILQGSETGTAVYVERHYPVTNANGLATLEIGTGTVISGDFPTIDWENDTYFIKTETDLNGGANYTITGVSQLLSVPYALHAKTAETANEADPLFTSSQAYNITETDIANLGNLSGVNTGDQNISGSGLSGTTLTIGIENGDSETVDLAPLQDGTGTDDQNISGSGLSGTTLTIGIENGDSETVDLAPLQDGTGTDDQNISGSGLSGTTLTIGIENGDSETVDLAPLANNWKLTGNAGTVSGTHFIGTTDNVPLNFKVNNVKAGRIGNSADRSVFLGYEAGKNDDLSNNLNTFIGYQAGKMNTSGNLNTANGYQAMHGNTTGEQNTANGYQALYSNTTGIRNSAFGTGALNSNTTGSYNTAIGHTALYNNVGKYGSTAIGYRAMFYANNGTSGLETYNTAIGFEALMGSSTPANNTGRYNTATGYQALYSNTTGYYNTANGYLALYSNTTGDANTAIGNTALYSNTTGDANTAIGNTALYSNTTGSSNIAIGKNVLYSNTTGDVNTAVGYATFYNGSNYTNSTALGYNVFISASNQIRLGNGSISSIGGYAGWSNLSDKRFKKNVKENVPGLDLILKLRPVTYNIDVKKLDRFLQVPENLQLKDAQAEKEQEVQIGFIAQEVEQAAKGLNFDFHAVDKPKNPEGHYGLRYAEFVPVLTKAVQEQQQIIKQLQEDNKQLQQQVHELDTLVKQLMAQ